MTSTNSATSPPATGTGINRLPFPGYFAKLAPKYARTTGNSTRDLFAASVDDITALLPFTSSSIIHDNAAGPGVATSVLLEHHRHVPAGTSWTIIATDNVPAMVDAARESLGPAVPSDITFSAREMDSRALALPDDHVSHSVLNFSIFNMAEPLACLREVRRTLQPAGVAAVLTWSRFGVGEVLRAAQRRARPDLPVMDIQREELTGEGVLARLVVQAGFDEGKVGVVTKRLVVTGEDLEGLREFCLGDISQVVTKGWSEEERDLWPDVLEEAISEEVEREGGILFEAWVVLATK